MRWLKEELKKAHGFPQVDKDETCYTLSKQRKRKGSSCLRRQNRDKLCPVALFQSSERRTDVRTQGLSQNERTGSKTVKEAWASIWVYVAGEIIKSQKEQKEEETTKRDTLKDTLTKRKLKGSNIRRQAGTERGRTCFGRDSPT